MSMDKNLRFVIIFVVVATVAVAALIAVVMHKEDAPVAEVTDWKVTNLTNDAYGRAYYYDAWIYCTLTADATVYIVHMDGTILGQCSCQASATRFVTSIHHPDLIPITVKDIALIRT